MIGIQYTARIRQIESNGVSFISLRQQIIASETPLVSTHFYIYECRSDKKTSLRVFYLICPVIGLTEFLPSLLLCLIFIFHFQRYQDRQPRCFMRSLFSPKRDLWPVFGWQLIGTKNSQKLMCLKQIQKSLLMAFCSPR